jgi:hypothetical protein
MVQAGHGGAIVNIGSMWVHQAIAATPSVGYSVAKAGLHALTKNLAIELGPPPHPGQRGSPRRRRPHRCMSGSSRRTSSTTPCTASTASTRSAVSAPPATLRPPSPSCSPPPPAGSPAPSGTSTAASWPDVTNTRRGIRTPRTTPGPCAAPQGSARANTHLAGPSQEPNPLDKAVKPMPTLSACRLAPPGSRLSLLHVDGRRATLIR